MRLSGHFCWDICCKTTVKDDLWWKTTLDTTFCGRRPLVEGDLWWKTAFSGSQLSLEEDLRWKTPFNNQIILIFLFLVAVRSNSTSAPVCLFVCLSVPNFVPIFRWAPPLYEPLCVCLYIGVSVGLSVRSEKCAFLHPPPLCISSSLPWTILSNPKKHPSICLEPTVYLWNRHESSLKPP